MSKRYPLAKWVLPSVVDPPRDVCVKLYLPHDAAHIAAFWGNMQNLGSAAKWGDDTAHTAKLVADVWREVIDASMEQDCCEIQYRLTGCDILEFSTDGGENWQTVADFSDCFVALHPATTARNIIMPSQASVVALTIQQFPGSSADIERWYRENGALAAVLDGSGDWVFDGVLHGYSKSVGGRWALGRDINSKIYLDLKGHGGHNQINFWSGFSGSQLFAIETPYFDPTRLKVYGIGYPSAGMTMRNTGEIGLGTDTPLARLHIKVQSAAEIGQVIQLDSAQAYSALETQSSAGTVLSGIDQIGRYFMAVTSGAPVDISASDGTIAVDPAAEKVWVKGDAGWFDLSSVPLAGDYVKLHPDDVTENVVQIPAGEDFTPLIIKQGADQDFYPLLYFSDNADLITAYVDVKGRYTAPTVDTTPSNSDGADGAVVINNADISIDVKIDSQWRKIYPNSNPMLSPMTPLFVSKRSRPAAGLTDECDIFVPSSGYVVLPWLLEPADKIDYENIRGWWTDQVFIDAPIQGFFGNGTTYFTGATAPGQPTDPVPSARHMQVIMRYATTSGLFSWGLFISGQAVLPSNLSTTTPFAWCFANTDAAIDERQGGMTVHFKITAHT